MRLIVGGVLILTVDAALIAVWDMRNSDKNWFKPLAEGRLKEHSPS